MNDFQEKLRYSLGSQQKFDIAILKNHIPHCISIEKTDTETDKTGIDYVETLKNGAKIYIDAKTREPGCSKYWRGEPELAIETYSVIKKWLEGKEIVKVGWTFKTDSNVDYFELWASKYPRKRQANKSYQSEAMFVPANVVLKAVMDAMKGDRRWKY